MNIAILTHPFGRNYGGLLQAFALQRTLVELGHEAIILNRQMDVPVKKRIKRFVKKIYYLMFKASPIIDQSNIKRFTDCITPITKPIRSCNQLAKVAESKKFDAYIVGSDQVWRPRYVNPIANFFLDFVKDDTVRKISYAASFGVDNWEFSDAETSLCRTLLHKFNAISVREESAVKLCARYFSKEALQVLDPTFLLNPSIYENIIGLPKDKELSKCMFSYIFDPSPTSQSVVEQLKTSRGLIEVKLLPVIRGRKVILPSVEDWLQHIRSSQLVVTDSFHVCVFSIIFHTPFYVLGNTIRGNTRIESLLKLFGLENRLIHSPIIPKDEKAIDWDKIHWIIEHERTSSINFLTTALS